MRIDIAFAIAIVLVISLFAFGYWEYRDRPISNPALTNPPLEELLGGWVGFENRLRLDLMLILAIMAVAISAIIRTISRLVYSILASTRAHLFAKI